MATPAQNRATIKYKKKTYKRVPLEMPKDDYVVMQEHAQSRGESINGFIKRAISETISRDKS